MIAHQFSSKYPKTAEALIAMRNGTNLESDSNVIKDELKAIILVDLNLKRILEGLFPPFPEPTHDTGENKNLIPLHLMSWIPPEDWELKVLNGRVHDGETISIGPYSQTLENNSKEIVEGIQGLVNQMREASPPSDNLKVPLAVAVLASIRHQSPLPPELWRRIGFPDERPQKPSCGRVQAEPNEDLNYPEIPHGETKIPCKDEQKFTITNARF